MAKPPSLIRVSVIVILRGHLNLNKKDKEGRVSVSVIIILRGHLNFALKENLKINNVSVIVILRGHLNKRMTYCQKN